MAQASIHKRAIDGIYTCYEPENPLPLVLDSPHSGHVFPADFDYACSEKDILSTEDTFVHELFESAPSRGAPLLCAEFPRAYLDLNRRADDIDPDLYEGDWPDNPALITPDPSNRSLAGIGLVRRLIRPGLPVYNAPLTPEAIQARIDTYYRPYHEKLAALIDTAHAAYGQVWHINCHSMPSRAADLSAADTRVDPSGPADFVLGDRDATTCDPAFTRAVRAFLEKRGYSVAINNPYKGVELVRRYSAPAAGRHSLQIEINKGLYMDETTQQKIKRFDTLKADLDALIAYLADYALARTTPLAAD
jgi:N-formylglutamate amidohydrolase